ncbi:MAG: hypothetical protein ICV73_17340, partial [Acetobacteraceae bacterium]|nr:hypothetical protein [Acetobacteraceae bacterium]
AQVASGPRSTVGGGGNNTASGTSSTVGGGDANSAGGIGAAVAGGRGNQASGSDSWVPGGSSASARGVSGKGAWASGQFAAAGDAQAGEQVLRRQTTDAAPSRLTADGGAPSPTNTANLPNNSAFACRILVVAKEVGGGNAKAMWDFVALARRDASAGATLVSSTPAANTAQAAALSAGATAGWSITLSADAANGGIALTAVGTAGATINWVARILSVEAVG